jgi:SAM-dependent methyltransferase
MVKLFINRECEKNIKNRVRDYINNNRLYNKWGYAALEYRCHQLFSFVNGIANKKILEIGGGEGLFSLWLVAQGASKVIVLEPEAEGSTHGVKKRFLQHRKAVDVSEECLILVSETFQIYNGKDGPFDLVLSYNSINHLDESACTALDRSEWAEKIYLELLKKVNKLLCRGGFFIISDCGRFNYWNSLGIPNPFARDIEWYKHQEPELWQSLLTKVGFQCIALEWCSFYPLRFFKKLLANSFFARWMTSQFIITALKPY